MWLKAQNSRQCFARRPEKRRNLAAGRCRRALLGAPLLHLLLLLSLASCRHVACKIALWSSHAISMCLAACPIQIVFLCSGGVAPVGQKSDVQLKPLAEKENRLGVSAQHAQQTVPNGKVRPLPTMP